ncbi:MAG TPA: enoyl-CoA hydratase/isomerase family protein [Thermoleophilaceae bacterium]|nr:enoyl-CoA hydratase/isomerase family protein [Thermoleophilaceae bacterium]
MTSYQHLTLERRDGVAVVGIDRPPANALDLTLLEEGHRVLEDLAADPPGPVVITGREGFFSAGMDLKVVPTLARAEQAELVNGINRLFAGWYALPRPVVAAVTGHAIAGGLILALCADHRVGSTGSGRYGLTELKAGIPYPAVAMAVVRAELSSAVARDLVLRARLVGAEEAAGLGLLDELVDGDPLPRALALAGELAGLPLDTYARVKRQLRDDTIAATARIVADGSDPLLAGWLGEETEEASAGTLRG